MLSEIRQPYVIVIGLLLSAAALVFFVLPMGEKAPFLFAVAIATGMATKSVVSMRMDAPNTALALFFLACMVIGATAIATDISVFLDAVWEGVLSGLAGVGVALLGEAQVRKRDAPSGA